MKTAQLHTDWGNFAVLATVKIFIKWHLEIPVDILNRSQKPVVKQD